MSPSTRLVDYVAIVGLDFASQRNKTGKLLQRFPQIDWPDTSFIDGIEFFCQPLGWQLTSCAQKTVPKFFQFVLTDIDVDRHYCACLTFYEHIHNGQQEAPLYAPKCIVLISRFDYREVFKNCLSIFYAVHVNNLRYSLETLIGNLLTCVKVPLCGRPSVRFSLSAGDCLTIQPPLTDSIPTTATTVYRLVEHLGINDVVTLFYAILTEQKILFYSRSYTRLNEACRGIIALMYPFKYSHTYIPILPATLIEFLSTPTPFIIGVHSSLKKEISDLLDVIVVDIDGGSVKVPDSLSIAHLDEPYNSLLITSLIHIFRPQIIHADDAFSSPSHAQPSSPDIMDKEIRAIFLRTITQILQGYRSCLTVIRIHPKSLISFHKASFLGQRGFVDNNDFMNRLLESMFFEKFVEARGLPYRDCDLFDLLHASLHQRLKEEKNDIHATIRHIKSLAHEFLEHENPDPRPVHQNALRPADDSAYSALEKPFPSLDMSKVSEIVNAEKMRNSSESLAGSSKTSITHNNENRVNGSSILSESLQNLNPSELQFVPPGLTAEQVRKEFNAHEFVINSARRLEVMRNCVNCIFDNKISDARKALPAVLKALKNKSNRLALIDELACHLGSQRAVLEHQQFDLVVKLMNSALQHEESIDLNGVAAKILPLAMEFCRRLCTGVIQFAFTCIQDHKVWSNQQFWEASFYLDVEKDIIALYKSGELVVSKSNLDLSAQQFSSSRPPSANTLRNEEDNELCAGISPTDSALEVTYKRLKYMSQLSEDKQKELLEQCSKDEESTVYSQAVHYANRIVCMKVPLDISTKTKKQTGNSGSEAHPNAGSSQRTQSGADSDQISNSDEESGFEDELNNANIGNSEDAAAVVKFVTRFVDKVCIDSCVGEEHIKALHTMIPQVVAMQIETLDTIYKESKRLPPVMKPKIINPDLIETEALLMPGLRTYLLPDGRDKDNVKDESIGANFGGPLYLPAEGAIFITNYRVIFKGRPCDPFYCEQTVVRSFPIATLTKEKRISVHDVPAVDQNLRDGLQLRSNTFQLIRIAFDEEVSSESIEMFRKHLNRQKSPANMLQLFAFTSQQSVNHNSTLMQKTKKGKSATLKNFAKNAYLQTAHKVGLKKKEPNKNRIPALVCQHAITQAVLLRSGGFQAKGVFDQIKKPGQTLYILTEKAQIKSVRPDMHRSCEFIPLDLHDVRQVKNNFAKFLRACVPSAPLSTTDSSASLAKQIETTEWFIQLKAILECSNNIVDLLDCEGKSVLLSIEDSWELTPQITSITQLCLDPYYRTFDGFRVLIEREWLAFGHRFSHKTSYTVGTLASGFTLMFLQFLDLVHQIHRQFPLSFEFNQYYLKFIAYHHVSCRFSTFLSDPGAVRNDTEQSTRHLNDDGNIYSTPSSNSFGIKSNCSSSSSEVSEILPGGGSSHSGHLESPSKSSTSSRSNGSDGKTLKPVPLNTMGRSFWDYAEKLWHKSPIFFNYYYTPVNLLDKTKSSVLKPCTSLIIFKLWDYFIGEELLHGPSYDIEVLQMARQHQEEALASGDQTNASKRRLVVSNYDCAYLSQPDGLTQLMGDSKSIEIEYNLDPSRWTQLWSQIETSLPVD